MKPSHLTKGSLDNLYTLDPHDSEVMENTNTKELKRMKRYLKAAIDDGLTLKQQIIIKMYYLDSKKTPEIASLLGVSPRTVQIMLRSAKKKLDFYSKLYIKSVTH